MRSARYALLATICLLGWLSIAQAAPTNLAQLFRSLLGPNMPTTTAGLGLTSAQTMTLTTMPMLSARPTALATGGFSDRYNSYAWSMATFKGNIYVGTLRYPEIEGFASDVLRMGGMDPSAFVSKISALPSLPDLTTWLDPTTQQLKTDPAADAERKFAQWNAEGAAEIWQYKAISGKWAPVFKAQYVPSRLTGKYTPETRGFRRMDVFNDGTREALFAFCGLSTMTFVQNLPLIFRTEDGETWEQVATPAGMGVDCRASIVHDGKLFVGGGTGVRPALYYTAVANPKESDWVPVDVKDITDYNAVTSLASFDGRLFMGTGNVVTGFEVWAGAPNPSTGGWSWERIVANGGIDGYNIAASTMKVFNNRLYVASMSLPMYTGAFKLRGFDLLRINPQSAVNSGKPAWELIMGGKMPAKPTPGYEKATSLSGWPSGFGNPLQLYGWSMEVYNNKLYLGTFDASSFLQYANDLSGSVPPDIARFAKVMPILASGADLWCTANGTTWTPVALNGLGKANNYGIRTMSVLGNRLILGTSNPFDGCEIYQMIR